jgi:arylformamidase
MGSDNMKIYDISVPISPRTPVYPGDPKVEIIPDSRISAGDITNVSTLRFGLHTGTHVDPPYHFLEDGLTVDRLPLDILMGECFVCDLGESPVIRISDLEATGIPDGTVRILFKTRNSDFWSEPGFRTDFTYLDTKAAGWLVERGIRLVGIDYLSIDSFESDTYSTHCKLLESGVTLIEGLDLRVVSGGMYTLICLPLKIAGGDGGPSRAVLVRDCGAQ